MWVNVTVGYMQPVPADVARLIPASPIGDCVLVGIDGVDGAGKTTYADALAFEVATAGRTALRISLDDFHHPAAIRHARGRDSPLGFWLDSYDYDRFRADVLRPLGRGGDRRFRASSHDLASDTSLDPDWQNASAEAVVVIDGLFLHRDEVVASWDFSIFLDVPFEVSCARLARRDGSPADPEHPANRRYVEGQRLYLAACDPAARASLVIT